MPKSHWNRVGPRRMFRPAVPKRSLLFTSGSEPTARKSVTSKYFCPGPLFPNTSTVGLIKSAVWELPGAFNVLPDDVTVNGMPLNLLMTLLTCQPPTIDDNAPLPFRYFRPLPNGNSRIFVICRLCGRSKLLSERFRL